MARIIISLIISLLMHTWLIWSIFGSGGGFAHKKPEKNASQNHKEKLTFPVSIIPDPAATPPPAQEKKQLKPEAAVAARDTPAPAPTPAQTPLRALATLPVPTPADYAGLARAGEDPAPKSDHRKNSINPAGANGGTPAHPSGSLGGPELEHVAQALASDKEGLRAPAYRVEGLTSELIGKLVQIGAGQLVAIHTPLNTPPTAHDVILFSLDQGEPCSPHRAQAGWDRQVAQRSIALEGALARRMRSLIQQQYGEETAPYLFLKPDLDLVILAAQLEACKAQGLAMEEVELTVGRFNLAAPDRPFIVTQVLTKKKREDLPPPRFQ